MSRLPVKDPWRCFVCGLWLTVGGRAAHIKAEHGDRYQIKGDTMAAKKKSAKQVRFLLSKGSPLKTKQKDELKKELHSGKVKVTKKKAKAKK